MSETSSALKKIISFFVLIQISLFPPLSAHVFAASNPRAFAEYWVETYGVIAPEADPDVRKTHEIFKRVAAVADTKGKRTPKLKIVNSPDNPWAIALPDGNIILSRGALRHCFKKGTEGEKHARIAFVLGHELGHMAEDDFWHLEVFQRLSGTSAGARIGKIIKEEGEKSRLTKEIKADDQGFLYASMAGYRTETLLGSTKGDNDFFTYWMKQFPHVGIDSNHPKPEDRAEYLRQRLKELSDKIDIFKYGVRLAHFGRYKDAKYFFEDFLMIFPSREVMNNLGYCNLQLAINEMPLSVAYQFWMPSVIDDHTLAEETVLRGAGLRSGHDIPDSAMTLLKEAKNNFSAAVKADDRYLPAKINLAVTEFFLGNIYHARAAVEHAIALDTTRKDLKILRALIMSRESPEIDMWPSSIKSLDKLKDDPEVRLMAAYNLAALHEQRNRTGKADSLWKSLENDYSSFPSPIRSVLDIKLHKKDTKLLNKNFTKQFSGNLPVHVGTDLQEDNKARTILNHWKKIPLNQKNNGNIFQNSSGYSILEFDQYVEMVVLSGSSLGKLNLKKDACIDPMVETAVMGGFLRRCGSGWSELVQDDNIKEIWVARK